MSDRFVVNRQNRAAGDFSLPKIPNTITLRILTILLLVKNWAEFPIVPHRSDYCEPLTDVLDGGPNCPYPRLPTTRKVVGIKMRFLRSGFARASPLLVRKWVSNLQIFAFLTTATAFSTPWPTPSPLAGCRTPASPRTTCRFAARCRLPTSPHPTHPVTPAPRPWPPRSLGPTSGRPRGLSGPRSSRPA